MKRRGLFKERKKKYAAIRQCHGLERIILNRNVDFCCDKLII